MQATIHPHPTTQHMQNKEYTLHTHFTHTTHTTHPFYLANSSSKSSTSFNSMASNDHMLSFLWLILALSSFLI